MPRLPRDPGKHRPTRALNQDEIARPTATSRLPALTGMRFIAAVLVFGFHLLAAGLLSTGWIGTVLSWMFGQGAVGVSFFFILSGFVLTWSARADDTPARFWQRRAAKIYPNHVVTWGIAICAAVVKGASITAAVAVPNLLLLQAWSPDVDVYFGLNTPSWSLACEVFFYGCFPLLLRWMGRLPGRMLWWSTVATMALIWLVPNAALALPAADRYWAIWIFPVARLPEFFVGMLLARIVREGRWPRLSVSHAVALTVAAYVATRYLPENFRLVAGTAVPLALLIAAVAANDVRGRLSWLATPRAVWLGEISYAFYLLHQLVLRTVVRGVGLDHSIWVQAAMALGIFGATLLASWLLYRWVEAPATRRLSPRTPRIPRHVPLPRPDDPTASDGEIAAGPGGGYPSA